MINNPSVSIRTLSRLLGKLSSSMQAVFPAPLHYRFLLMAKTMALKKTQGYESILFLNQAAQEELLWWRDHLPAWNGRSLLRKKDDLLIETDASNLGWDACCNGLRTGGIWSHQESLQHVNCSSPVLASLVYEIWQWCLERERDLPHSTAHSWHLQQFGRQGIQSGQRFVRLETRPNSLCSLQRAVGFIRGGSVRDTAYKSASQVCELETRSRGGSDRRFLSGLVSDQGLCIPPFQSGRSLPIPSARKGYPASVSCSPSMGDTTVVSSTVTSECRFSTSLPNRPRASQQGGVASP